MIRTGVQRVFSFLTLVEQTFAVQVHLLLALHRVQRARGRIIERLVRVMDDARMARVF
jgi:hypothetical protein